MRFDWKVLICIFVPLTLWLVPAETLPLVGLTVLQQRLLAIFTMAVLLWIFEPVPIFATSVLIIMLELLMISDQGPIWLRQRGGEEAFGALLSYKEIMATFASPIILLFLGGFFLAKAATKYRLDINLARVLIRPFGTRMGPVMLGIMLVTAVFSMFMSNTATTAMMLAVLMPLLSQVPAKDPGRIALVLSVPFAANVGGIGTPIGTPPNAVAIKYLTGDLAVSFAQWMAFAVPYVLVLLVVAWAVLLRAFPSEQKSLKLDFQSKFMKTAAAYMVYATFGITIFLWLTEAWHGMSSYVVALIPVTLFVLARIVTPEDMKTLSWDVLWLVSGGIALGLGMEKTGLSQVLVNSVPFEILPPLAIVALGTLVAFTMANLMSHTATANLLLPIMAALGTNIEALQSLGGSRMLLLTITFTCSLAMSLPISTPPNALAHASGFFRSKQMAKVGIPIGLLGVALTFLLMFVLKLVRFF